MSDKGFSYPATSDAETPGLADHSDSDSESEASPWRGPRKDDADGDEEIQPRRPLSADKDKTKSEQLRTEGNDAEDYFKNTTISDIRKMEIEGDDYVKAPTTNRKQRNEIDNDPTDISNATIVEQRKLNEDEHKKLLMKDKVLAAPEEVTHSPQIQEDITLSTSVLKMEESVAEEWNSVDVSLKILFTKFYEYNDEACISIDQLCDSLTFKAFLNVETRQALKIKMKKVILEIWGKTVELTRELDRERESERENSPRSKSFKIELSYLLEESKYITPSLSEPFKHPGLLNHYLSGSIVSLEREVPLTTFNYIHTGILMKKKCGETFIIEVNGEPGDTKSATVMISPAMEVVYRQTNAEDFLGIDNKFVPGLGIEMDKLLYRFARTYNMSVNYKLSEFNCDVFANWLQIGVPAWLHKNKLSKVGYLVDWFKAWSIQGRLDLKMVARIEATLSQGPALLEESPGGAGMADLQDTASSAKKLKLSVVKAVNVQGEDEDAIDLN